jgi:hypothetical protein
MSFDNRLIAARYMGGAARASFAECAVMEWSLMADIVEKVENRGGSENLANVECW